MAKRVILIVIILAMLSVATGTLAYFFIKPEPDTTGKNYLTELATDYYENDFYNMILKIDTSTQSLAEKLDHYSRAGFAEVYLRQLLIFKGNEHQKAAEYLKKHCDENRTYVQYYPEPPYGRKNYHVEYVYSCDFK